MQTHPNASAATMTGAATVLVVYVASLFGLHVPVEAASAFTTIITAAVLAWPGRKPAHGAQAGRPRSV